MSHVNVYWCCAVAVAAMLGCGGWSKSSPAATAPATATAVSSVTEQQLFDTIAALREWTNRGTMPQEDWARYMEAARLVQQAQPAVVEKALDRLMKAPRAEKPMLGFLPESKAWLLMRVTFDLPTHAPKSDYSSPMYITFFSMSSDRGRCVDDMAANPDGTVNISWPVDWNGGKPRLLPLGEYGSVAVGGPTVYEAVREYRYFLEHYKFRELR